MPVVKTKNAAAKYVTVGYVSRNIVREQSLIYYSLGRRATRFKVPDCDRHYMVHEDLLCANSGLFKARLQKKRKAVSGDCPICHEDLSPEAGDITFCRAACGQNLHEKCMEDWNSSRAGATTCPMCRTAWSEVPETMTFLGERLDQNALQVYIDWLYRGNLRLGEGHGCYTTSNDVLLLQAMDVAEVLVDKGFQHALVAYHVTGLMSGEDAGFRSEGITETYECVGIDTQGYIVDSSLATDCVDWLDKVDMDQLPAEFVQRLCRASLPAGNEVRNVAWLLSKYTEGEYELKP